MEPQYISFNTDARSSDWPTLSVPRSLFFTI